MALTRAASRLHAAEQQRASLRLPLSEAPRTVERLMPLDVPVRVDCPGAAWG
jgi:hypothetical protein